jgi:hypothetical protein
MPTYHIHTSSPRYKTPHDVVYIAGSKKLFIERGVGGGPSDLGTAGSGKRALYLSC